jgi:hypothetical protein
MVVTGVVQDPDSIDSRSIANAMYSLNVNIPDPDTNGRPLCRARAGHAHEVLVAP